jgi:hypothetical protein
MSVFFWAVEGPEPVLAMVCAGKRLHQSGVSVKDQKKDKTMAGQATRTAHFLRREFKKHLA